MAEIEDGTHSALSEARGPAQDAADAEAPPLRAPLKLVLSSSSGQSLQ